MMLPWLYPRPRNMVSLFYLKKRQGQVPGRAYGAPPSDFLRIACSACVSRESVRGCRLVHVLTPARWLETSAHSSHLCARDRRS